MLSNILNDLVSALGIDIGDSSQKNLVIAGVNQCAEEIYKKTDLKGALMEQVFDLDVDSAQVSLPYYVGEVRGARHYDSRLKISINTYAPRYHYGMRHEVWALKCRKLRKSPLAREISNESTLTFRLPLVETSDVVIKVIGPTNNSAQIEETITILAGELEAESVGNFKMPLNSIQRVSLGTYNVTILDAEDNELGIIPNNQFSAEYNIYQVMDWDSTENTSVIECLYKLRFTPFRNDYDEFICGPEYDKAIYWKYMEHELGRQQKLDQAVLAAKKCADIIKEIGEDANVGMELEIGTAPSPYFGISDYAIGCGRYPNHYLR